MIRNIAVLIAVLALAGIYTYFSDRGALPEKRDEKAAPDFSFQDMTNQAHRLSDYAGKTIVLNFWASWCAPCMAEFPAMIQLAEKTKDKSVFLFISIDAEAQNIEKFLKKMKFSTRENVIIGRDPDLMISQKLYGTYQLPETYLITSTGRIGRKIVGADYPWDSAEAVALISTLSAP